MLSRSARLSAIIALGHLAPFWWGLSAPRLTIELLRFGGSVAVFVPNILLGLGAGFILTRLANTFPLKGWVLFWAALVGAVVVPAFFFSDDTASLSQIFFSPGNVAFMLATLVFRCISFLGVVVANPSVNRTPNSYAVGFPPLRSGAGYFQR